MNYDYPILNKIFKFYNKQEHNVKDLYLVCCQHLLEPQLKMIELLIKFGFSPNRILVLEKVYSSNKEIVEELISLGVKVIRSEFNGNSFDKNHEKNCEYIFGIIPNDAKSILIDDGAQLIKTFNDKNKEVLFAVEQTSSGFRKLQNESLQFPVFNVARSNTKLIQESPLVAHHLYERMISYFNKYDLIKLKILVVGLGPIGESISEIFKENNFEVDGFDIKLGHSDLVNKIKDYRPNVIIGATGNSVLNKDDIESLYSDDPLYLISASSSDREFPVLQFRTKKESVHDDVIFKNIIFVNNGFPFTFVGNRNEMLPIEIEKTICLLCGCVMYGSIKKISESKLIEVPQEIENLIN